MAYSLYEHDSLQGLWEDKMKAGTGITLIMLIIMISCLLGTAAAAGFLSSGSYISTGTSVSVKGSVNETVSVTRSTIGSGIDKTEWITSYKSENPAGLAWNSHLTLGTANGTVWVNYFRSPGLSPISWSQIPGR
jgi:hypothetical protein